jgi:hypothetical protein
MRFHRYDVEFLFEKGENLVLVDMLSKAYLLTTKESVDERHMTLLFSAIRETDMPNISLHEICNPVAKDFDKMNIN